MLQTLADIIYVHTSQTDLISVSCDLREKNHFFRLLC